jgi:DNA-directed RNA polymerase subunit RPC12/RpoP
MYRLEGAMYKCYKCGRDYEELPKGSGDRLAACACGSRVFMKMRPQMVKKVRAI